MATVAQRHWVDEYGLDAGGRPLEASGSVLVQAAGVSYYELDEAKQGGFDR